MRKILTLVLAALIVQLSACAGLGGLGQQPEVSVADVKLLRLGLFEQGFALQLRIRNPNDVELPISGLSFSVEVNGQPFVAGLSDQAVNVPRFGEALLAVTATSTLANALKQFHELQKGGRDAIDYRIVGRLQLATIGAVPFERRGELRLPGGDKRPAKPAARGAEGL